MEQILQIFPNSQKFEHAQTVCTRLFFYTHTLEPGNGEKLVSFFQLLVQCSYECEVADNGFKQVQIAYLAACGQLFR